MLKRLVRIATGEGRAVAAQDFRGVIVRIETDAQQVRLFIKLGLLLQLLIDNRKVIAHQCALIGHGAARVNER